MIRLFLSLLLLFSVQAFSQQRFNGNMENLTLQGTPRGWDLSFDNFNTYDVKVDSVVKVQGKYSVLISSYNRPGNSGAISFKIPDKFVGRTVTLIGSIKTENVTDGFAGLWLRSDGPNGKVLDFENMEKQQLKGTNDWKEYIIQLPYRQETIKQLSLGAVLVGKGKIWVDSLRLYIDEKPVEVADIANKNQYPVFKDLSLLNQSKVGPITVNKENVRRLNLLGQLWVLLKYHHKTVASGKIDWDAELFRIIPNALSKRGDTEFSATLEQWVDSLGPQGLCNSCSDSVKRNEIALSPDYGDLFKNNVFNQSLKSKLRSIIENRNAGENYYVGINKSYGDPGNPQFDNENPYANVKFPDIGFQILALYRYWGIIQYYFPSRQLIPEKWSGILNKYLPLAMQPQNKREYTLMVTKLISEIHDAHARIISPTLEEIKGKFRLPAKSAFIGNKLVVTGFYKNFLKDKLRVGDIIESINGISVKKLVRMYYPVTSASNREGKLYVMIGQYLLRSSKPNFSLIVIRGKNKIQYQTTAIDEASADFNSLDLELPTPGYTIIENSVAYINPRKFNSDIKDIRPALDTTKGIIIDLRTYPGSRKTYELIDYIKSSPSPFVIYTYATGNFPGQFKLSKPMVNGINNQNSYRGMVCVIVNAATISQAEATVMSFQSAKCVRVIGSVTAGADGTVSQFSLPGGIDTGISGIGMLYPNGINTQRSGVHIDYLVRPTLKGILQNRDELMEKALQLLNTHVDWTPKASQSK